VKDAIADITLQQVLTRPDEFDVIATMNLNGDYLFRRARRAGRRHRHRTRRQHQLRQRARHLRSDARHRAEVPGQDKVNPGSVLLSGVMMFEHLGWQEAADDIVRALEATIADKVVTYDFARLMEGATEVKCSEFAQAIVDRAVSDPPKTDNARASEHPVGCLDARALSRLMSRRRLSAG